MIVSLEAISLATFVLITQTRMADKSERRADLALLTELEQETPPEDVLARIDTIRWRMGTKEQPGTGGSEWQ